MMKLLMDCLSNGGFMDIAKMLNELRGFTNSFAKYGTKFNKLYINKKTVDELVEYFKGNSILQEYIQKRCFGMKIIIDNTLNDGEYKIGVN